MNDSNKQIHLTGQRGQTNFILEKNEVLCNKTTTGEMLNLEALNDAIKRNKNKYSKFNTLKTSGQSVISSNSLQFEIDETQNSDVREANFVTTQQLAFGKGTNGNAFSNSRRFNDGNVIPSFGRSGRRVESGIQTSGLLGEQYNNMADPRKNSFVQRCWKYDNDPALILKRDGVPSAQQINYMSLPIGSELDRNLTIEDHLAKLNKDYRSRGTDLIFNPLSKTGYKIFMDDDKCLMDHELKYHYRFSDRENQ